jgi:hypothetical protein
MANPHWSGRFGHTTVVAYDPKAPKDTANNGYVFLMGGDSNSGDPTVRDFTIGKLDSVWNNGYKNDVWRTSGTEWMMRGNMRIRTDYRQKAPKVTSEIKWTLRNPGLAPPVGVTYDNWIICQQYFLSTGGGRYAGKIQSFCPNGVNTAQWSPRRHHAAVYFKGTDGQWAIYVVGGRAREYVAFGEERSVGGVSQRLQPRAKDVANPLNPNAPDNQVPNAITGTSREAIVYKSDVWRSYDGDTWELVTPGCKAPQAELVNQGNVQGKGWGKTKCTDTSQCYGAETCDPDLGTCVCLMWSPREQHALVSHGSFMYLSGGYTSFLYPFTSECGDFGCGDTDASAYRYYLNDVWSSPDGLNWKQLTKAAFTFSAGGASHSFPRGGHTMIVFNPPPSYPITFASPCKKGGNDACAFAQSDGRGYPELWVFGGRGGENELHKLSPKTPVEDVDYYYNDIWVSRAQESSGDKTLGTSGTWFRLRQNSDPSVPDDGTFPLGRTGHTATLTCTWPRTDCLISLPEGLMASPEQRFIFIVGGQGLNPNPTPPQKFGVAPQTAAPGGTGFFYDDVWAWRPDVPREDIFMDFTPGALFGTGSDTTFQFLNNSPSLTYVTPSSPVSQLIRLVPPTKLNKNDNKRLQQRPYMSSDEVQMLFNNSIMEIQDFANSNLSGPYTILKLRGFDFPQVPMNQRLHFEKICDVRALAIALTSKCAVQVPKGTLYDGERNQPWNIIPEWGAGLPGSTKQNILWHGPERTDYKLLFPGGQGFDDADSLLKNWDGCAVTPSINDPLHGTNFPGLGYVQQVSSIRDPLPELQELQCKWTPGVRAYHSALFLGSENRLYIFGGKSNNFQSPIFMADTWYRDAIMPTTRFKSKPLPNTDNPFFWFTPDEAGVVYEYRVWDPVNYIEVRPWTKCTKKTDVGWLSWRKNGPGNGLYSLYVRSIDPSGNRDERFVDNQNVYTWYYVSPTPYDIIFEAAGSFFALALFGYLEYRRRVRKAAMERYAMKRMRRKFKAMQRDIDGRATDWRTLYMESKAAEEALKGKKKAKKALRDKKKEKRDKVRRPKKNDYLKQLITHFINCYHPPTTGQEKARKRKGIDQEEAQARGCQKGKGLQVQRICRRPRCFQRKRWR